MFSGNRSRQKAGLTDGYTGRVKLAEKLFATAILLLEDLEGKTAIRRLRAIL